MKELLLNFWSKDEGQSLVEYGLIITLVAIVLIFAITALGMEVSLIFDHILGGL